MPIYYNPASPTPSTKNTINSVAVTYGIRDFLLNKNLLPSSSLPAGYSTNTAINGSPKVGEPVLDTLVNSGSNVIPNYLPLETEGIVWKDLNILNNTFKNTSSNADNLKSIDYIQDTTFTSPDGLSSFGSAEWPQGIQSYPQGIESYGLLPKTKNAKFKLNNVTKNLYLDESKQLDVADFIVMEPGNITQQLTGYLETYGDVTTGDVDKYGSLNLGKTDAINASNAIGSILNGQGLGLAKGGIVDNFDIRSSLAGRVLSATGLMTDTKLGTIGGQQLALALANNAAFNIQQDILGKLNIKDNVLSLVKGNGLAGFRPNYSITVPEGLFGKALDYIGDVLGFTLPRSYVTDHGSIFQSESGEVDNITRANDLLKTTGKGQLLALIENVRANQFGTSPTQIDSPENSTFRTGYAPAYFLDNRGNDSISDGILYAFYKDGKIINLFNKEDGVVSDLNYLREEKVSGYGFQSPEETGTGPLGNTGYNDRKITDVNFIWTANNSKNYVNSIPQYDEIPGTYTDSDGKEINNKKSLLVKTQKLFNSTGMKNIVATKGDMNKKSTQIQQANGNGFSHGNAVMQEGVFINGRWDGNENRTADETYCRSWTTLSRYDTIDPEEKSGLVRHDKFYDTNKVPFRFESNTNSVLEDTGFVKVAPYTNDFINSDLNAAVPRNAKNYMLSIENLAWNDRIELLPKGERGLGDPLTGKKGRIMWFPPYDIQISESVSVDWEPHKFIGRGENIYTYNNTERTGQLSFKIIVDHSTYSNTFRGINGPDDHYVASFMAGCIEPDSYWTDKFTLQTLVKTQPDVSKVPQKAKTPPPEVAPDSIFVFFPNDRDTLPVTYESGISGTTGTGVPDYNAPIDYKVYLSPNYNGPHFGLGSYPSDFTYKTECANNNGIHEEWPDRHNYGLNYSVDSPYTTISKVGDKEVRGWFDQNRFTVYTDYIKTKCPHCDIEVAGFASPQGRLACNQQLSDARADRVIKEIKKEWCPAIGWSQEKCDKKVIKKPSYPIKASDTKCNPKKGSATDTLACKFDRRVKVKFVYNEAEALSEIVQPEPCIIESEKQITQEIRQKFYNETMFFDKLEKKDKFIFDKFREKIRYFHPAFHSTTPEGLNSRLTFLHQCTRQGPTLEEQGANNLAFGRAPICILRVGDFFYTKIAIDSLSIEYEPLVWDLNPEGIGVQPMIANVSLSFKFIGAESLYGPINKLQNALSFNYYANTRVYEARADYISEQEKIVNTEIKDTAQIKSIGEINISSNKDKSVKLYLNNGETSVNPEITTFEETVKSKNSCDVDQGKANENGIAGQNNQSPSGDTKTQKPKITFNITNIGGLTNNRERFKQGIEKVAKITFGIDITISSEKDLDKDYDAKLIMYDYKMIGHEVQKFTLEKGKKEFVFKDVTYFGEEPAGFNIAPKTFTYQLKLDIIGLYSVSNNNTVLKI